MQTRTLTLLSEQFTRRSTTVIAWHISRTYAKCANIRFRYSPSKILLSRLAFTAPKCQFMCQRGGGDLLQKFGIHIPRADPDVDTMCLKFYGVPGRCPQALRGNRIEITVSGEREILMIFMLLFHALVQTWRCVLQPNHLRHYTTRAGREFLYSFPKPTKQASSKTHTHDPQVHVCKSLVIYHALFLT